MLFRPLVKDDLLDLYGDENFGKQLGGDILNAKKMVILLKQVLSMGNQPVAPILLNILMDGKGF